MRNNPESESNQEATKQNEREIFALKMMHNTAIEESNALDHCDLMMDEFERIKAIVSNYSELPYSSEIRELCVRAIEHTKQMVPVVTQLRTNQSQLAKAIAALEPFGEMAETVSKDTKDHIILLERKSFAGPWRTVTTGDLRLASTTLAELKGE